jgi:hypothetical protein
MNRNDCSLLKPQKNRRTGIPACPVLLPALAISLDRQECLSSLSPIDEPLSPIDEPWSPIAEPWSPT